MHLLWINLITDSIPAMALGMEKAEPNLMSRPPRSPRSSVLAEGLGFDIVYQGLIIAVLTIASYFVGHYIESGLWEIAASPDGITMAFLTLSMIQIFHSINLRSRRESIFGLGTSNKILYWAALASLALTTLVIFVPFLRQAFEFEKISVTEYAIALGLAILIIPVVEFVKLLQRQTAKSR